ncbi:C40 family peptidase [Actinocorallia lasiicapitis]
MGIGVAIAITLSTGVAMLAEHAGRPATVADGPAVVDQERLVATSNGVIYDKAVAKFRRKVEPQFMITATGGKALPAGVLDRVKKIKGVTGADLVYGNKAKLGDKWVGVFGVDPSTFRNFTPDRTAKSDDLWQNIASGDVAISFTLHSDGGVNLREQVAITGSSRVSQARVGAYATMGVSGVDAVVSKATAQRIGMSKDNVMLVAAKGKDLDALKEKLKKALPKKTATVSVLNPAFDFGGGGGGAWLSGPEISRAINSGYTKINMPYVWGGESDAEGGYDCSGLVQWAFRQAGIAMPRVAEDQARTGPWLPFNQARPGDLLIWANDPSAPGRISHIAIFLGGDKMLVAPRTGDVIKIQQVYLRNFRGAVRVNRFAAASLAKTLG